MKFELIHALPVENRRVLSRSEAASYSGVSIGTFDRLVRQGQLPPPLPFTGVRRWDKAALDTALDTLSGLGRRDARESALDLWRQQHGQS